jgi:hypothetical protein
MMNNVDLRVPATQIRDFSLPLTSVMSQDLALQQQGALRLQTSSANLRMFSTIHITSPLRICFPLLNPSELQHYHVSCVVILSIITF